MVSEAMAGKNDTAESHSTMLLRNEKSALESSMALRPNRLDRMLYR